MPTLMQRELANELVKNKSLPIYKRKNKKDLLVSTGYSLSTAESEPNQIIESKGVKDALKDFGLTEKLITECLVDDIKAKPQKRFLELSLGAEILGMKTKPKDDGQINQTLVINISEGSARRYGILSNEDSKPSSN